MIEGFIVAAASVMLGQWIAKWRNAPRTRQPQWPVATGLFLGRLIGRLRGKNTGQRGRERTASPQQIRYIPRA